MNSGSSDPPPSGGNYPIKKEDAEAARYEAQKQRERDKMRRAVIFGLLEVMVGGGLFGYAGDFLENLGVHSAKGWCSLFGMVLVFFGIAHVLVGIYPSRKRLIIGTYLVMVASLLVLTLMFNEPDRDADGNPIGLLLPANDPMPAIDRELEEMIAQHNISSPTNRIFLLMGSNFIMLDRTNYLPVVRFHEKDMISISVGPMGASVSGEFFDKDNKLFASMEKNRFILNRLNYVNKGRPDRSTLIVTNQDSEILNIRFCRTNFFTISGRFHFSDGTEAVVTKSNVTYRGFTFHDAVFSGAIGLQIYSNGAVGLGSMRAN